MQQLIYAEESYLIIGICMEVHRILGKGHSEVVYKDALEYEFKNADIEYSREQKYKIKYKKIVLHAKFYFPLPISALFRELCKGANTQ